MQSAIAATLAVCPHCHGTAPCIPCLDRIDSQLAELAELWGQLDPAPGGPEGGRRSPGWGSRSPARDDVLVLTDRRSDLSVARALASACRSPALSAALRAPQDVPRMIGFLRTDWVLQRLTAADAAGIAAALARVRAATGRAERTVPVGACPVEVSDPDGAEPLTCSTPLRAPLGGAAIVCPDCGTRWERDQWPALAALSRALNVA